MNYAYARVSAKDQNLQRQITAFREFGLEKSRIFSEKKSGKDFERKEYKQPVKRASVSVAPRSSIRMNFYLSQTPIFLSA